MGITDQESIAKLQVQVEFFNEAFKELKQDVKDVNGKLDSLLIEWQKFGGLYNAVTAQQMQINEFQNWKATAAPIIAALKDSKKRWLSAFMYVVQVVTATAVLYILGFRK